MKKEAIQSAHEDLKSLMELWSKFRKFFLRSFAQDPISREEEEDFLEVKSSIARYQRIVHKKIQEGLYYGADNMRELLRQSISINHLRTLPVADRQELYRNWHSTWIALTRTLGAFKFFNEVGFVHLPKKGEQIASVAQMKKGIKDAQQKEKETSLQSKVLWVVAAVAVIGVGIFIYLSQQ